MDQYLFEFKIDIVGMDVQDFIQLLTNAGLTDQAEKVEQQFIEQMNGACGGDTSETGERQLHKQNVTNRTFKCNRCGTIYTLTEGTFIGCCTMPTEHRTSGICGGELIEVVS